MKRVQLIFLAVLAVFNVNARAQEAPLRLTHTIPLPGLHDGYFDHFAVDLQGYRLFLTAEENAQVEVFDLRTNKLVHTINDVKAPHSILYRAAPSPVNHSPLLPSMVSTWCPLL